MAIDAGTDMLEATPEDVGLSSARLEQVSALMRRYVDSGRWAGALGAVACHGRVAYFPPMALATPRPGCR